MQRMTWDIQIPLTRLTPTMIVLKYSTYSIVPPVAYIRRGSCRLSNLPQRCTSSVWSATYNMYVKGWSSRALPWVPSLTSTVCKSTYGVADMDARDAFPLPYGVGVVLLAVINRP